METAGGGQRVAAQGRPSPGPRPPLRQRVGSMAAVWLLFGAMVGACSRPPGAGLLGLVSFMLAGMLLLPFLGALLGALGGRSREALIGGAWGLTWGVILARGGQDPDVGAKAAVTLLVGGIAGATLFPVLGEVWRRLLGTHATLPLLVRAFGHAAVRERATGSIRRP
jgi:hypothetical protein